MKPLRAAATTSQPVLTLAQIDTIFFKVPELYEVHREFYDGLLPRVQQWSLQQRVGELFHRLVRRPLPLGSGRQGDRGLCRWSEHWPAWPQRSSLSLIAM